MVKISRVTAMSMTFILLAVIVLVSRHPYIVYARTISTCDLSTAPLVSATLSNGGGSSLMAGSTYSITVTASDFTTHYQNVQLGFDVRYSPTSNTNSVRVDRVFSPATTEQAKGSSDTAKIDWAPTFALEAGTYTLTPVVIADAAVLTTGKETSATLTSLTATQGVFLDGTAAHRVEVATGQAPNTASTEQQLVQYALTNTTNASQDITVHWRLYSGGGTSAPLLKQDVAYTQTVVPGENLTRPYFLDTHLIGTGWLETELDASTAQSTQILSINGTLNPLITVGSVQQWSSGMPGIHAVTTAICFTAATVPTGTTMALELTDSDQNVLWQKTLTASTAGEAQEYSITDLGFSFAWPLTFTSTTTVNNQEVAHTATQYRP